MCCNAQPPQWKSNGMIKRRTVVGESSFEGNIGWKLERFIG